MLNGRRGVVFRHNKATDRVEVRFPDEPVTRSLHAERLRLVKDDAPNDSPRAPDASAAETPDATPSAPETVAVDIEAMINEAVASTAAPAKTKTVEDLEVGDNIEVFGLSGYQAEFNGKVGTITEIKAATYARGLVDRCAVFGAKFSDFYIDDKGDLAEKGQALSLPRAHFRVPGTGPPGEIHEKPPAKSFEKPAEKSNGFSKAKRSPSRSRSRARRRHRSPSKSRRRGKSRSRGRKRR